MPMSLFDEKQMMRKANKGALGKCLKKLGSPSNPVTSLARNSPIVIDGGWLLHQITTFLGCETYGDVT